MKAVLWMWVALAAMTRTSAACDLDCTLEQLVGEEKLAGAVYGIVEDDDTTLGAVGFANYSTRERMRADSKVHIGSVTKTMLALGVLRLASQGRVDLDAPLDRLLTAVPLDNPWRGTRPVTLRHLLDHTSGLDDLRLWQLFSSQAEPRTSLQELVTRTPGVLRVRVEPGTRFSYSNTGYTLAGMAIEAVTRERYEAWLDRELLKPLGLVDSTFEFISQTGAGADPRLAWGHFDDFSLAGAHAVAVRPAAQFTTTAGDMMRVARFLMSDGRIGSEAFIDEALLRQMGRARTPAAAAGLESGYALGLARRDRHGAVGDCHIGNIIGYRAVLCVYRDQRKAFFIAHNSDSETARYLRFDELLAQTLKVAAPVSPSLGSQVAPLEWQGRYVLTPARFEQFRYFDLLFDSVDVTADARGLTLQPFGGESQTLVPVGHRLYRAADRTRASHVLLAEGDERLISDGTRTWQKISGTRFVTHWVSLALGLLGLATLLLLIPWRAWRRGEPLMQPASIALLLLLVPVPLFALQPFMAIGDLTAATGALFVATVALPLLTMAQVIWAWRARARVRSWRVHVVAAGFVLQWCAVLVVWDLIPFATWR